LTRGSDRGGPRWDERATGPSQVHVRRARLINGLLLVMTVVFALTMAIQVVQWPNLLLEERGLEGEWNGTVTSEWGTITITPDIDLRAGGTIEWEVAKGPGDEVVADGSMWRTSGQGGTSSP
jgi:hypothetical protein